MSTEPTYRPCPFCGATEGKPQDGGPLSLARQDNTRLWSIDCLACGTQGPTHIEMKGAVDLWNDRVTA